eukprot:jgi/Botrbrau1/6251/Bobra.0129s0005.1
MFMSSDGPLQSTRSCTRKGQGEGIEMKLPMTEKKSAWKPSRALPADSPARWRIGSARFGLRDCHRRVRERVKRDI